MRKISLYSRSEFFLLIVVHFSFTFLYTYIFGYGATDGLENIQYDGTLNHKYIHSVIYGILSTIFRPLGLTEVIYSVFGLVGIQLANLSFRYLITRCEHALLSEINLCRILIIFNPYTHLWTAYPTKESLIVFIIGIFLYAVTTGTKENLFEYAMAFFLYFLRPANAIVYITISLLKSKYWLGLFCILVPISIFFFEPILGRNIDAVDRSFTSQVEIFQWLDHRYHVSCTDMYASEALPVNCDNNLYRRLWIGIVGFDRFEAYEYALLVIPRSLALLVLFWTVLLYILFNLYAIFEPHVAKNFVHGILLLSPGLFGLVLIWLTTGNMGLIFRLEFPFIIALYYGLLIVLSRAP